VLPPARHPAATRPPYGVHRGAQLDNTMASIVYAMCGEGRGHATRARAVVEGLRRRHQVTLFASGCAHAMLAPVYRDTEVRLSPIPGLRFSYDDGGRVALVGTVAAAARFRFAVGGYVRAVLPELERAQADLVIADFEPILPRAARKLGVPFVSFDHQHYLVVSDLRALPGPLRRRAAIAAPFVEVLYDWQKATIVSSFYAPPLKPAYRGAIQVGTLIRPELLRLRPERGAHLLCYLRRHAPAAVLEALAACGRPVRIYGVGELPPQGALQFRAVDQARFIEDLATCQAVVSTAGNQLVGEALHLGKPMLVLPEPRNFEQEVNAYFLASSGAGWAETGRLTPARLGAFLERLDGFRACIDPARVRGNEAALRAIEDHLGAAASGPVKAARPEVAPREQWA
jgi:uncharacterized protein (TIGR00661 family)